MNTLYFFISWSSNAFFLFLTFALLVQGGMSLLRVKSYRLRAFLRMIPLGMLVLLPFLNEIHVAQFLNPLRCDGWLQQLLLYVSKDCNDFVMSMRHQFVLFLKEPFSQKILSILLGFGLSITAFVFIYRILKIGVIGNQLRQFAKGGEPYAKEVQNEKLSNALKGVKLVVSHQVQVPMAVGLNTIILPKSILELCSVEEVEAVIAHELTHLYYKDPLTRLLARIEQGFFWWVPMKKWLQNIEDEQESSCDQNIKQYDLSKNDLASAIVKITKASRNRSRSELSAAVCRLTDSSPFVITRLHRILDTGEEIQKNLVWKGFLSLVGGLMILLSCAIY